MSKDWVKILPGVPPRDPSFMTCGGVSKLNTSEFEQEMIRARGQLGGPKLGEAGAEEFPIGFMPNLV